MQSMSTFRKLGYFKRFLLRMVGVEAIDQLLAVFDKGAHSSVATP
jgi:hypothetical protein